MRIISVISVIICCAAPRGHPFFWSKPCHNVAADMAAQKIWHKDSAQIIIQSQMAAKKGRSLAPAWYIAGIAPANSIRQWT